LGVFFLALFSRGSGGGNGLLGARALFGSLFGLSGAEARLAAVIAAATVAGVLAIARPLLFASVDADVARARGVPVRALGVAFLALVGATTAQATQAIGALLLLGLLAAPAGAAHRLTPNPYLALALSAAFALGAMWLGLALSYAVSSLPPSTAIVAIAAATYALSFLLTAPRRGGRAAAAGVAGGQN
jgi:zinc/manganese transport system permease protein